MLNSNVISNINTDRCNTVDDTTDRNLKRTKGKETFEDDASLRNERGKKRRKLWFQNQYTNNDQFRMKILSQRKVEYLCQKEKKLNKLKTKYKEMEEYRSKLRKFNRDRYNTNEKHRENLKKHSEEKYRTNAKHKEKKKQASKKKYRKDMKHQKQLKEKITAKYKDDASFRENVKRSNKLKYQDKDYQLRKRMYTKKNTNKSQT